jgi:hypothetical protein
LVGNLLEVEALPSLLRMRILDHAEGNPFYVEEVIRSLIDSGVVIHDETTEQWQATQPVEDIAIPDTLQGVLMARIDRLEEEARRVLQLASVIGRIFLYRVLATIAQEDQALDQHLSTLQREEMIRERVRGPELEYAFKHHLTQEAAYKAVPPPGRGGAGEAVPRADRGAVGPVGSPLGASWGEGEGYRLPAACRGAGGGAVRQCGGAGLLRSCPRPNAGGGPGRTV